MDLPNTRGPKIRSIAGPGSFLWIIFILVCFGVDEFNFNLSPFRVFSSLRGIHICKVFSFKKIHALKFDMSKRMI